MRTSKTDQTGWMPRLSDLSLRWAHLPFCWFCHVVAQILTVNNTNEPGHVSYVICEQQRRRSACASAQSDQHLCCSLLR